jgi:hypothetical protein
MTPKRCLHHRCEHLSATQWQEIAICDYCGRECRPATEEEMSNAIEFEGWEF